MSDETWPGGVVVNALKRAEAEAAKKLTTKAVLGEVARGLRATARDVDAAGLHSSADEIVQAADNLDALVPPPVVENP